MTLGLKMNRDMNSVHTCASSKTVGSCSEDPPPSPGFQKPSRLGRKGEKPTGASRPYAGGKGLVKDNIVDPEGNWSP